MKKLYEVEIYNEHNSDVNIIESFGTLEEAKACANEKMKNLWEEMYKLNHDEKSELVINHLEVYDNGDMVADKEIVATIYKDYIINEEHEEQLKALDNVTIYNTSTLEGWNKAKFAFENNGDFEVSEDFEVMLEIKALISEGHLYELETEYGVEWFDDSEKVLEALEDLDIQRDVALFDEVYETFYHYLEGYGDLIYEDRPKETTRDSIEIQSLLSSKPYVESIDVLQDEVNYFEHSNAIDIDVEKLIKHINAKAETELSGINMDKEELKENFIHQELMLEITEDMFLREQLREKENNWTVDQNEPEL